MSSRLPRLLIVLFLAVGLSGCGGAASSALIVAPAQMHSLASGMPPGARDLGRLPGQTRVSFLLLLRDRSAAARERAIAAMYDPHSSHFGQFQTPGQWAASGPARNAVAGVERFLRHAGLRVAWQRGNDWLTVSGPSATVSRVFGARIDRFRAHDGQRFYAATGNLSVPRALRRIVSGAGHLSSYSDRRIHLTPASSMSPTDVLAAYDLMPLRNKGMDGSGETVAFIEIDGFQQSDFDAFTSHFNLPAMHPSIAAGPHLTNVEGEAEMDLEVVHEIAPKANLRVYNCSKNCTNSEIIGLENRVARDNPHGIVSISLGGCEPGEGLRNAQAERSAFDQADAQGESVFVASGDSGAYECLTENWGAPPSLQYVGVSSPASMPGVTAVGGTRLIVNANSSWAGEQTWEEPAATGGTGGGISSYFKRPAWQRGSGVASADPSGKRDVPDVAAAADPLTSIEVNVGGHFVQEGGTSQAAPIWAGMTALIDQYLKSQNLKTPGFMNPALYAIAAGQPPYSPFHDVTVGTNLRYPAAPGYDMATGLGSPDAWNLARDLAAYMRQGHP